MKRILVGIVSIFMLIAGSGVADAQEGTGVSVGIKMWINDWTESIPGPGSTTSDSTLLLGPAIEANFSNNLYLDASYLFATSDYSFPDTGQKFDRQDLDVAVGYYVVPGFGLETGYKSSWFNEAGAGIDTSVYGPILGIRGIAQFDPYLSFYGRLDYLFTRFKSNDPDPLAIHREDSPGWLFEFGIKYAFTGQFTGSIGYKYETNEGRDSNVRDSFSGLTLSGMVSF
jgi:opacity protein-like surface antigen